MKLSFQGKLATYFAVLCLTTLFLMNDAMSNGTLHEGPVKEGEGPELKSLENILTYCDKKPLLMKWLKMIIEWR